MPQTQRILICPLDWGLGHATRCIPLIRLLLEKKQEVIIAADGRPYQLLKQEFPQLQLIRFPGYDISYPSAGSMLLKMFFSVPKIIHGIKKENTYLQEIIKDHKIDIVISDNRYGCYNKNVKSIFITHQLMIKSPFGERFLHKKVLSFIRKFNECWIPDFESEPYLSGDLSHKYPLPAHTYFIGTLSRFETKFADPEKGKGILIILSGPEPQRSILEDLIISQAQKLKTDMLVVRGIPGKEQTMTNLGKILIIDHMGSEEMEKTIRKSELIFCRSGYSSIMDLQRLNKKAVFIPTPGQTEQEYLASYLQKKGIAYFQKQAEFDLLKSIQESEKYSGFSSSGNNSLLEKRINDLLS
jgi:uncharacterized protein (TIGR00661 family)